MTAVGDEAPRNRIRAMFVEAVALHRAGRWQDASERFHEVLAAIDEGAEDDPRIVLDSAYMKVVCLHKQGDFPSALTACDAFDARFGASTDPRAIDFGCDVLWLKSQALNKMGDAEQALAVLRRLIQDHGGGPQAHPQVARAMYNEGGHLRDKGCREDAVRVWDQLFARFAPDPPKSDPFIPIRGQLAKAAVLAEAGRIDAALITCERMLEECDRLHLPDARVADVRRAMHGCIARQRKSRGFAGRLTWRAKQR